MSPLSPFTLLCALLALVVFVQSDKLNVHIVPHTHDDVGWLKTVDQYYLGANNSIQHAGVQYILDSVIISLQQNPDRRFVYVEQAFFQRWYREQTSDIQSIVKKLVANGQLELINGGWCMHDEATTHYVDMVDQTTLGHRFIKDEFGVVPRIGWQIDPFGHSATQAALLSAEVGFDALFFGRIDYQDSANRFKNKELEFVWRGSASLGRDAQIFTGAFQSGNYGPPSSFCYDEFCNDQPINDDPRLEDNNVQERVDAFVKEMFREQQYNVGNNLMIQMGSDFQYENANLWFKNLDKLIHYVNLDGRIQVNYSTPTQYVRAKYLENITWSVKTDDFFPYADNEHGYWTGYFTSRPALKRYVRVQSAYLQATRQIEVFTLGHGNLTSHFSEVQGVAQHHDAVSGTSKQHVAFDYARRLSTGSDDADRLITTAFAKWTDTSAPYSIYQVCHGLNVSICDMTQQNKQFVATYYNPLARARTETVSIPIESSTAYVYDSNGQAHPSQVLPTMPNNAKDKNAAPYTVVFQAQVPGLGYTSYLIQPTAATHFTPSHHHQSSHHVQSPTMVEPEADPVIENQYLKVVFDGVTGLLKSITNKESGLTETVSQNFYYYRSKVDHDGQSSGAYVFRNDGDVQLISETAKWELYNKPPSLTQEFRQTFTSWITQIIRLNSDSKHLELEYTVGAVPIEDGIGKEVISRFTTRIQNKNAWYTDSNGREFQTRVLNYRPTWNLTVTEPIAGNYYPINAVSYIHDDQSQLTILNDRSQGCSSLVDGQLELMVHRRLLADDNKGVTEPLNETARITCVDCGAKRLGGALNITGTHYLVLETPTQSAAIYRPLQDRIYSQLVSAYTTYTSTPSDWAAKHRGTFSQLGQSLPFNVELMTLEARPDGTTLLRVSHQFGIGEDKIGSQTVQVDLAKLFGNGITISNVVELSLTANQKLSDVHRLQWNTQSTTPEMPVVKRTPLDGTIVTLTPLSIHTFSLILSYN